MTKKYTAQCACGAVKFGFNTDPDFIANCHCLDCKRASGGEMATFFAVPQDDFTLVSGHPKAHRYIADRAAPRAGGWVEVPLRRREGATGPETVPAVERDRSGTFVATMGNR